MFKVTYGSTSKPQFVIQTFGQALLFVVYFNCWSTLQSELETVSLISNFKTIALWDIFIHFWDKETSHGFLADFHENKVLMEIHH